MKKRRPVILSGVSGASSAAINIALGSEITQVIRHKVVRTRNKQSLAESEAKISACARKQERKCINRRHQYVQSILMNPIGGKFRYAHTFDARPRHV